MIALPDCNEYNSRLEQSALSSTLLQVHDSHEHSPSCNSLKLDNVISGIKIVVTVIIMW